jgi:hypothetical protein
MITFVAIALAVIPAIAVVVWVQDHRHAPKWRAIARERRDLRWTTLGDHRPSYGRVVLLVVIALVVPGEAGRVQASSSGSPAVPRTVIGVRTHPPTEEYR